MENFMGNVIENEIFFVYGLIALVIILIFVIIIIDKRENKKQNKNLFDTLNMKIISENQLLDSNTKEEIVEIKQKKQENIFSDLEPITPVEIVNNNYQEEDIYKETDLEKTQAQIRVEEITKALEEAQIEEKIEEDKYIKFEEEQEKNAIISYNELKESFDKLYQENEKTQYLEDDSIPINMEELYQINNREKPETNKVKLEDIPKFTRKQEEKTESTFKNSPFISPVYGIQAPPIPEEKKEDKEIQNANQFLQNLKELQKNLD